MIKRADVLLPGLVPDSVSIYDHPEEWGEIFSQVAWSEGVAFSEAQKWTELARHEDTRDFIREHHLVDEEKHEILLYDLVKEVGRDPSPPSPMVIEYNKTVTELNDRIETVVGLAFMLEPLIFVAMTNLMYVVKEPKVKEVFDELLQEEQLHIGFARKRIEMKLQEDPANRLKIAEAFFRNVGRVLETFAPYRDMVNRLGVDYDRGMMMWLQTEYGMLSELGLLERPAHELEALAAAR